MKYLKIVRACLRKDPDAPIFVVLPVFAGIVCLSIGNPTAAMAFLIATLMGVKHALDWPERYVGAKTMKLHRELEERRRNEAA